MNSADAPAPVLRRLPAWLSATIIILSVAAAWYNSLSTPFFFDDEAVVLKNPTIRHLWPIWTVLSPPAVGGGSGVTARPMVNLSLAINYALGGVKVRGYHIFNVLIHMLAALALLGIVRRTLALWPPGTAPPSRRPAVAGPGRYAFTDHDLLALAVALLWALHPLLTESVTCVVQRTESLLGLFYLTTLYCFVRAIGRTTRPPTTDDKTAGCRAQSPNPAAALEPRAIRPDREIPTYEGAGQDGPVDRSPRTHGLGSNGSLIWFVLTFLACLAGMATKEVMVSAPLVLLLYDRTFVAGTFREAWRRRRKIYLALAATWILLGYLVINSGGERAGTVGFGLGASVWSYALTQCRALVLYLKLSVWPHPFVIDYGTALVHSLAAVWWQAVVVLGLLGLTAWALVKKPRAGFLGAWFFLILAPSSSFLPLVTQTIAEHRMYLSLAAPVALGVLALYRWIGRDAFAICAVLALALGWLTVSRNHDYRTTTSIWADAVAKDPSNPRAHGNLGNALLAGGHYQEAVGQYRDALRLKPDYNQIYNNLGNALLKLHRPREAVAAFKGALRLFPLDPDVHNNLGNAFLQLGQTDAAIREYEISLRVLPDAPETEINLASALLVSGRIPEAIRHYRIALRLQPRRAATHVLLADALIKGGGAREAAQEFRAALRLQPGLVSARFGLGNLLARGGDFDGAIAEYHRILQVAPGDIKVLTNLGNALLMSGRVDAAIAAYQEVLRRQPDNVSVRRNLQQAHALQREGRQGP